LTAELAERREVSASVVAAISPDITQEGRIKAFRAARGEVGANAAEGSKRPL
jgi:hypothetical protein